MIQFEYTTLKPQYVCYCVSLFASEDSLHIRKAETRFRNSNKSKDRSGLKCPLGNAQECNPSLGNRAVSEVDKATIPFASTVYSCQLYTNGSYSLKQSYKSQTEVKDQTYKTLGCKNDRVIIGGGCKASTGTCGIEECKQTQYKSIESLII